ncbi:hypothetical protein KAX35_05345, partial [candidate division WOR-3 bacterium]|nr:hypothetical protein [candidate division WOR-3 bacterium]
ISFMDSTEGWAVYGSTGFGSIYHYKEGQWTLYDDAICYALYSVYTVSRHNAWAVGESGYILHFSN